MEVWTCSYQAPEVAHRFISRSGETYTVEPAEPRPIGTQLRLILPPSFPAICERAAERNDFALGQTLRKLFTTLRDHGALYEQAEIGVAAAKLARARGSTVVSAMYLEEVEAIVPQPRQPKRITEALQTQRPLSRGSAMPLAEAELIDALTDDPERNLELQELRAALRELGVVLSVRSSEEYQIELDDDESPVRGIYAFLAVPGEVETAAVLSCLQSATANWLAPVTYRGLLKALGMADALARQEQWADRVRL